VGDGDRVRLTSATGSLQLAVVVSDLVPAGVAVSPKGRWPRDESQGANVNVLNPGAAADMGGSSAVHGVEVTVTRV
jgi:anaerobic selenocysteine-containing dehydrogenase